MTPARITLPAALLVAATLAAATAAAQPAPVYPALFPFPGATLGPADAASAGVGLADRFLGDEPFDNPAAAPGRSVRVTPQLGRVSRQDIHAANRDLDDGSLVFDFAGARASAAFRGTSFSLYASQPVFRVDNLGWTVGRGSTGSSTPAAVVIDGTAREQRFGLALSRAAFRGRVGLGGEWVHRDDAYDRREVSGSPDAGTTHAEFGGDGFAFTAGGRWEHSPDEMFGWTAGASLRWNASLNVDGTATADLVSGSSSAAIATTRASGVEGGAALRMTVGRGVRAYAALGGATARDWPEFARSPGAATEARLGLDLRDPEAPWVVRFGVGEEQQPGTAEPRAGHVSVGFGWVDQDLHVDAAVLRRTLDRPGAPRSHDDRAVVSVGLDF